jgi:NADPH2:quinone reductase
MRAVLAPRHGGPDVLVVSEQPEPELSPGAVRVAVQTAAVNFPDVLVLAGSYQVTVEPPYVPGCEFFGRVLEVASDVTAPRAGDAVIGMATHGAFADQVVIEASRVTRVPAGVDPVAAAAFGVTYTTAYHALRSIARVQPGEWVVVLGAAGGVGLAAVELAHVLGAKVLAAASGGEKLEVCRAKGADEVVDYTREDMREGLKDEIRRRTGGDGADVVIDPVGGPYAEPTLRATRWGARYVVVGFASGEIPCIPLNLVLLKGVSIVGFENRTILQHLPDVAARHRAEVVELFARGRVSPHVSAVYPIEQVACALEDVASRRVIGKVVIDMAGGTRNGDEKGSR